jgi:hypothetical protein
MLLTLTILGFFILGVVFGFYAYRELARFAHRQHHAQGVCYVCDRKAYVTSCERCRRQVAMCHYFSILGMDSPDPAKLRVRRGISVCERCLTAAEKEILESMMKK